MYDSGRELIAVQESTNPRRAPPSAVGRIWKGECHSTRSPETTPEENKPFRKDSIAMAPRGVRIPGDGRIDGVFRTASKAAGSDSQPAPQIIDLHQTVTTFDQISLILAILSWLPKINHKFWQWFGVKHLDRMLETISYVRNSWTHNHSTWSPLANHGGMPQNVDFQLGIGTTWWKSKLSASKSKSTFRVTDFWLKVVAVRWKLSVFTWRLLSTDATTTATFLRNQIHQYLDSASEVKEILLDFFRIHQKHALVQQDTEPPKHV